MYYLKLISKTAIWVAVISAVIFTLALLVNFFVSNMAGLFGWEYDSKNGSLAFVVITLIIFHRYLARWPFEVTFRAKRVINASPDIIWDQTRPRARRKNYNAIISSIQDLGDGTYRYRYHKALKGPPGHPKYHDTVVRREEINRYIEFETLKKENSPDTLKTTQCHSFELRDLGDGKTEVTSSETHLRPSMLTIYIVLFIGALKDSLRQLACACEGRENISWASAEVARSTLFARQRNSFKENIRRNEEFLIMFCTTIVTVIIMIELWNIV